MVGETTTLQSRVRVTRNATACLRLASGGLLEIPGFCGVRRQKRNRCQVPGFPGPTAAILYKRLNNYKPGSNRLRNFLLGSPDLSAMEQLGSAFKNQFLVSDFHGRKAVFSDVPRNQGMRDAVHGGYFVNRQISRDG